VKIEKIGNNNNNSSIDIGVRKIRGGGGKVSVDV